MSDIEQESPVEPEVVAQMNAFGQALDMLLNPNQPTNKTFGWVINVFRFGEEGRMNYISNARRKDMICALKELIANLEGRKLNGGNA